MASGMPWIKLYNEFLDDPKVGRLTPGQQLLFVKLLLVAGECDAEGLLSNGDDPLTFEDIAWRLRFDAGLLATHWQALESAGLVETQEDGSLLIIKFSERQGRPQSVKREQWRQRQQRKRDGVTDEESVTGDTKVSHAPRVEESREEKSRVEVVETEQNDDDFEFRKLGSAWAAARGGLVNSLDSEELHTLQGEYTYQWVYDAIIEANSARSRGRNISMNFVKAILSRWHQEGKDTPYDHQTKATEAAKDEAAERTRRQVAEWEAKNA